MKTMMTSSTTQSKETPQGVVFRISSKQIILAFDEIPEEIDPSRLYSIYMCVLKIDFSNKFYIKDGKYCYFQ